jgi:hypothetical protein
LANVPPFSLSIFIFLLQVVESPLH